MQWGTVGSVWRHFQQLVRIRLVELRTLSCTHNATSLWHSRYIDARNIPGFKQISGRTISNRLCDYGTWLKQLVSPCHFNARLAIWDSEYRCGAIFSSHFSHEFTLTQRTYNLVHCRTKISPFNFFFFICSILQGKIKEYRLNCFHMHKHNWKLIHMFSDSWSYKE